MARDTGQAQAGPLTSGVVPLVVALLPGDASVTGTVARRAEVIGWRVALLSPAGILAGLPATNPRPVGFRIDGAPVGAVRGGGWRAPSWSAANRGRSSCRGRPLASRGALGTLAVALLGAVACLLSDIRLQRALSLERSSTAALERETRTVAELGPLLQSSLDLAEVLPAVALRLADEFALSRFSVQLVGEQGPCSRSSPTAAGSRTARRSTSRRTAWTSWRPVSSARCRCSAPGAPSDVSASRATAARAPQLAALSAASDLIAVATYNVELFEREQASVRRLRELDQLKDAFLSTISHELRTPLTAISGFIRLLRDKWDQLREEQRKEFLERVHGNTLSLGLLVDDLLDFARLERQALNAPPTPLNLDQQVEKTLAQLAPVLGAREIVAELEPVRALANAGALERVLANLLTNAAKFSPPAAGSSSQCVARVDDATLEVADHGSGIAPEDRERVFARFYRGDSDAARGTRGAGIGLSVVRELVHQMGGTVVALPNAHARHAHGRAPPARDQPQPIFHPPTACPCRPRGARHDRPRRPDRHRRDRAVLAAAVAAVLLTSALIVFTVLKAERDGTQALERLQTSQVQQLARSMDTRIESIFTAFAGIVGNKPIPWSATLKNPTDLARSRRYENLNPAARTGFLIIDQTGRITNGTLLRDPARRSGTQLDPARASARAEAGSRTSSRSPQGSPLPARPSTSPSPSRTPRTRLVGALVIEPDVSTQSDFNAEVSQLSAGKTAQFSYLDENGTVIASSDASLLGKPLHESLVTGSTGFHRGHGKVAVVEAVPTPQWRAVFIQDASEFDGALTGPLKSALVLIVLAGTLAAGVGVVFLARRLRAAREEQRRLMEVSAVREEFISIVSHELRTPVAGLLGFLQTTLDHWDGMAEDERRRAIGRSLSSARRLHALTRDVLDTGSMEAGGLSYSFSTTDLRDEVSSAVLATQDLLPGPGHPTEPARRRDLGQLRPRAHHPGPDEPARQRRQERAGKRARCDGRGPRRLGGRLRRRPGAGHERGRARPRLRQVRPWAHVDAGRHRSRAVHLQADRHRARRRDRGPQHRRTRRHRVLYSPLVDAPIEPATV